MANAVADAIRAIADRNNGRLTPDLVVEAAMDKASPLHSYFTWDKGRAAKERWLDQARTLIRSVKVEVTTTQFTVQAPAFVRDPAAPGRDQGYVSLGRLRTDADLALDAAVDEFSKASAALARAKTVALALGLNEQIEEVREHIVRLAERASQATA